MITSPTTQASVARVDTADVLSHARRRNGSRFAGLWTPWRGVRGPKSAPVEGEHELFGFLMTEPNAVVAPIRPKAMPVILTNPAEIDLWLAADAAKALELQRPLRDDVLKIVASGEREDRAPVLV
jgi:putative SOS response-associated peptidase YedK